MGSEGLPEGPKGLPEGLEGLAGGPWGGADGCLGVQTGGWRDGENFSPFYRSWSCVGAAAQKACLELDYANLT